MTDGVKCDCEPCRTGHKKDTWYQKGWRPLCAIAYISICIFDFGAMPVVYEMVQPSAIEAIELAQKFEGNELEAYRTIQTQRSWEPLTLKGGGLFHLAFGALLTGAAVTRGLEKKARNG